jgi:ATP-dependent helicase YprA (DUF1998 family)
MLNAFKTSKWVKFVSHIFIDEAHCVVQWGDGFRPKYSMLCQLRTMFPEALLVALTATATLATQKAICKTLSMNNVNVVSSNINRGNIKYICERRLPNSGSGRNTDDSYTACFLPFIEELAHMSYYPKTVIFTGLKWCGFAHHLACQVLRTDQQPLHFVECVTQYHAHLTASVRDFGFMQL